MLEVSIQFSVVLVAPCELTFVNNSNIYGNETVLHGSNTTVTCSEGYLFPADSDFDGVWTCDNGTIEDEADAECRSKDPSRFSCTPNYSKNKSAFIALLK